MRAWLSQTLAPYRAQLALMLGIQLIIAFLVAVQPLLFQQLLGLLVEDGAGERFSRALSISLTLGGIFLFVSLGQGVAGYVGSLFSSDLLRRLQTNFFEKTAQLPLDYFKHHSGGEFFTRFNHDVGQAQSFMASILPAFIREGITISALVVILVWSSPWELLVAAGVVTALSTALAIWCHKLLERFAMAQRTGWSAINRQFDETVRGIDTVKTFGAEARRAKIFEHQTARYRDLSANAGKISALFSPSIDLATRLGSLLLVVMAYLLIARNNLTVDAFLLFFFCAALLQASASSMIQLYTQMPPQIVGIRNLARFFLEREEAWASGMAAAAKEAPATIERALPIEFKSLRFAYPGGKELYRGADINIPANSITVIKGPNGSGKSTLINLLLRFNEPNAGRITIGGVPLSLYSREELRSKISVVTQYHHIFHDSLRENLLIAKPDAADEELFGVLQQVGLTPFLNASPNGLDQVLDSSGKGMSGGEKQKLCIARLLLRQSPVLVLDEPWANLDDDAGNMLSAMLEQLAHFCTLIIITHRMEEPGMQHYRQVFLPCELSNGRATAGRRYGRFLSVTAETRNIASASARR